MILLFALVVSLFVTVALPAQDPAAERLLQEAQRLEGNGDYQAALDEYVLLVQQFPKDRLAAAGLLRVIELRRALGDDNGSRAAIQRMLDEYPRSAESAAAFLAQADLEAVNATSRAEFENARTTFRRIPLLYGRERYPRLEARARARIRSGEISRLLGELEIAEGELLAAIEDEPPSLATGRAQVLLASALLVRGEWVPASEILERLVSDADDRYSTVGHRQQARHLLSLVHRLILRPAAGASPWATSRRYPSAGLSLRQPSGVAAHGNGSVVIVDERLPLVALLDPQGQVQASRPLEDVMRPGWTADGRPFVVGEASALLPFSGDRAAFSDLRGNKAGPLKNMLAAELGLFGEWFVLAKGFKSLLAYDGQFRGRTNLMATDNPQYVDLARDAQGQIYLLDADGKRVVAMSADRQPRGTVVSGAWKRPTALALDALGNVYVLDRGERRVDVYRSDGQRLAQVGPTLGGGIELRQPVDIAVDGGGRLLIADEKLPFVVLLE